MPRFRVDLYAWIPDPDVPNPIYSVRTLPGIGPGACGPRFGGDNMILPPRSFAGWANLTYRAMQTVEFMFGKFGGPATITLDTGVQPGITTVLTDTRARGGKQCHAMRAAVASSPAATVTWSPDDKWYELVLSGGAQDPVPADVARRIAGGAAGSAIAAILPGVSWNVFLRFQQGTIIPASTKLRYALNGAVSFDRSDRVITGNMSLTGIDNLVHGMITVTQFPSYVLYLTAFHQNGRPSTRCIYFADGSSMGLGMIVLPQSDVVRQTTW